MSVVALPKETPATARTGHMTTTKLRAMKERGEKIVMLTAYDATTARIAEQAGIQVLLVGDTLGMVVQGHDTTVPVTLDEMLYHTRLVVRGTERAFVIGDRPELTSAGTNKNIATAQEIPVAMRQITDLLRDRHRIQSGTPDDFRIRDQHEADADSLDGEGSWRGGFAAPILRTHQTAIAGLTSGSEPRPALMNSTMTATATSKIPEIMKASK